MKKSTTHKKRLITDLIISLRDKLNMQLSKALEARKKAQSALTANWRRFVDIAEMSPDWIWECDANLHFTFASAQFVTATGLSRNNILGRRWAEIVTGSGSKALSGKLESNEAFHDVKISMPSIEGKSAQWMISGRPVYGDAGAFMGYRGIGTDISDVKRADDRAGEYSDHLEELINLAVMDDEYLDSADRGVKLTPREREVLGWVKQGKSYADIAEILSISRRTIEFHIGNVMNKLGASNRVSAVVIAMRRGLLGSLDYGSESKPSRIHSLVLYRIPAAAELCSKFPAISVEMREICFV